MLNLFLLDDMLMGIEVVILEQLEILQYLLVQQHYLDRLMVVIEYLIELLQCLSFG
jgi:hypothetical protein